MDLKGFKISNGSAISVAVDNDGNTRVKKITFNKKGKIRKSIDWISDMPFDAFMRANNIPVYVKK
jgi:hypothetical protein